MYQEERIYQILKLLKEKRTLSNQEIMDLFGISRDTARRDIVRLVEEGVAVRTHGGITMPALHSEIVPYKKRLPMNLEVKKQLAQKAAGLFRPGQLCFMDAATTVAQIYSHIPKDVTVYTNSCDNITCFENNGCEVHIMGGRLDTSNYFVYGSEVLNQMDGIRFDMAFLGAASINEDGIYVEDQEDAFVKRKAAQRAAVVCVIADDSKYLKTSRFRSVSFEQLDILITNQLPPEEVQQRMKEAGVKIKIF